MISKNKISVSALRELIDVPDVRIVDASWHLPVAGRNAHFEYLTGHIPGAVFFDTDGCVTPSDLPHMMPSASTFATYVGDLGISQDSKIVIYDSVGLFSAARVWWMFRKFGASNVSILDGGLPAWIAAGNTVEAVPVTHTPVRFVARFEEGSVANVEDVVEASVNGTAKILDARPYARFTAEQKEARPGVRSGHIPGSISLPFTQLIADGQLCSVDAIRKILSDRGVQADDQIIVSCGSGVTAAVIALALEEVGREGYKLYDGAWAEWGSRDDLPMDTGPN